MSDVTPCWYVSKDDDTDDVVVVDANNDKFNGKLCLVLVVGVNANVVVADSAIWAAIYPAAKSNM